MALRGSFRPEREAVVNARAYYNEHDPFAAEWLRRLVAAGHVCPGDVDERDIRDVRPDDLAGYTQCHFFAGIGGWSLALRLAGWPDDRPVWTGSCPCQPFSAAGQQRGAADERHLWPTWFGLIDACRPPVIFGEQVASAQVVGGARRTDEPAWLDAVFADLEGARYACGAADLPAAGVGAPHIRQRLWFVAQGVDDTDAGQRLWCQHGSEGRDQPEHGCQLHPLADRLGPGLHDPEDAGADRAHSCAVPGGGEGKSRLREPERGGAAGELGDATRDGRKQRRAEPNGRRALIPWHDADWLPCRDGKARPVEPGTFPLAHGVLGRVGRLRAYGNAIVPQVAAEFIAAAMMSFSPEHSGLSKRKDAA